MSPQHLNSGLSHSKNVAPSSSTFLEKYEYRSKNRQQMSNVLQGQPASLNARGLPSGLSGGWHHNSNRDGDDDDDDDDDERGGGGGTGGGWGWGGNVVGGGTGGSGGTVVSSATSGPVASSWNSNPVGGDGSSSPVGSSGAGESSGPIGGGGTDWSSGPVASSGTGGNSGMGGNGGGWNSSKGYHGDGGCSMCTLDDNDPRVQYTGLWVVDATRTHSTVSEGSTVSLRFNGSSIVVFGTVPANGELEPPAAAYFLDNAPPSIMTLPNATSRIPNQPLYASPQLSSKDEHLLFINVTQAQAPYILAGFFIIPLFLDSNSTSNQDTPPPTTPPTSTSSIIIPNTTPMTSSKATSIVAGVLGSLVFLFVVGVVIFLILRWRTHARRQLSERLRSESSRSKPETIYSAFTTTESILRNDPSIWYLSPSYNSSSHGSSQVVSPPSGASLSSPPSSTSSSTSPSPEKST